MKRLRLEYLPAAIKDYESVGVESERRWGRNQTRAYLRSICASASSLTEFPGRGSILTFAEFTARKIRSGSHLIIYRYGSESVEVIRILHERMDLDSVDV